MPGTGCVRRQGHFVHWGARDDVGHAGHGWEFQQSADFGQELGQSADFGQELGQSADFGWEFGQSADFGQELDQSADLCWDWLPAMSAVVHSERTPGLKIPFLLLLLQL